MRLFVFLFAFIVPLSVTPSAHAWGERGHRLIAEIAYGRLTPGARAGVDALLASDFSGSPGCPIRSFADAALWSDCVRSLDAYRNQSSWHYDNLPLCGSAKYAVYCAGGNCATAAIARAEHKLRELAAPARERQRALARIVHLIGDIHQPLHAVTNKDRGGNDVRVDLVGGWSAAGNPANLHALWDTTMVEYALNARPGATEDLANEHVRDWGAGDALRWTAQSHDIAVSQAYGAMPGGAQCNQTPAGPTAIDERYAAEAAPIVREQLAKAGLRLAATLNRIF